MINVCILKVLPLLEVMFIHFLLKMPWYFYIDNNFGVFVLTMTSLIKFIWMTSLYKWQFIPFILRKSLHKNQCNEVTTVFAKKWKWDNLSYTHHMNFIL